MMRFATFCHVSEYGTSGYERLDLMMATSDPLYLWAPSSVALRRHVNGELSVERLIEYVEAGRLRIIARNDWLVNGTMRRSNAWPGAAWDKEIDGRFRTIYEDDEGRPFAERRVVGAPPEDGWGWADQHLEEHPEAVDEWYRVFTASDAGACIPEGVLESAKRALSESRFETSGHSDAYRVTRSILRDARNHMAAIRHSGAEVPIFLSRSDPVFYKTVAETEDIAAGQAVFGQANAIVGQVLEVLEALRSIDGPQPLHRFLSGHGHEALIGWISRLCHEVRLFNGQPHDGVVKELLLYELSQGTFQNPVRQLLREPRKFCLHVVELVLGALGVITHLGPLSVVHAGVSITSLVRELRAGRYTGPHWPFLYVYGDHPSGDQAYRIERVLKQLTTQSRSRAHP